MGTNAPSALAALMLAMAANGAVAASSGPSPGRDGAHAITEPQASPEPQVTGGSQETPDDTAAPRQATPDPPRPPEPVSGPASMIAVPTRDVFDILRELRHKPPKAEPAEGAYETLM